jgi:cell wall assembly regulator SMI1
VKVDTWAQLNALFDASPLLRAGTVGEGEVRAAEKQLGIELPDDYRKFIMLYGGALVGPFPIYGLRLAKPMGKSEGSFVEVTRQFRKQRWRGVDDWVVFSTDHSGNPIGLDRSGVVWLSDHDRGSVEKLADDFDGYIRRWCLGLNP